MIVFGGGCLNVHSGVRDIRHQPIDRGHRHRRPGRDINRRCVRRSPDPSIPLGDLLFDTPLEGSTVGPDAMQDDGNLARDSNFGLLGTDPLH